jgi:hypothetical protein
MRNIFDDANNVGDYFLPPFFIFIILVVVGLGYLFSPCVKCGGDGKINKYTFPFKKISVDCPKCTKKLND